VKELSDKIQQNGMFKSPLTSNVGYVAKHENSELLLRTLKMNNRKRIQS
jgi:hypothetical protein